MEEYSLVFTEHANKLVEVANLACSMSGKEDGVKMVRYAAAQIENLCPQVIILFDHAIANIQYTYYCHLTMFSFCRSSMPLIYWLLDQDRK